MAENLRLLSSARLPWELMKSLMSCKQISAPFRGVAILDRKRSIEDFATFTDPPQNLEFPAHRSHLREYSQLERYIGRPLNLDMFCGANICGFRKDDTMIIRDAIAEDATAACQTMRRSIAELCAADHHNDPDILQRWLNNKTPEIFKTWIKPDNSLLVAVEDNAILAVGNVTAAGKITLNYVSPDARFRGVSSALLIALERRARDRGNAICELESTETARRFYLARGYSEDGTASAKFGTAGGYPMTKRLGII